MIHGMEDINNLNKEAEDSYLGIINALGQVSPKSETGRRDFRDVSDKTGLNSSWLSQLADKKIGDGGYKKLFILKEYLSNHGYLSE